MIFFCLNKEKGEINTTKWFGWLCRDKAPSVSGNYKHPPSRTSYVHCATYRKQDGTKWFLVWVECYKAFDSLLCFAWYQAKQIYLVTFVYLSSSFFCLADYFKISFRLQSSSTFYSANTFWEETMWLQTPESLYQYSLDCWQDLVQWL